MGLPTEPIILAPAEVAELNQKLSSARHNVNNCLSLMVAAIELIRRKPEMGARLMDNMAAQPEKIIEEMRKFSEEFDKILRITRENSA